MPASVEAKKLKAKAKTSLTLLLVAVISITTATYAWFSLSNSTTLQQMQIEVSTGVNLRAYAGVTTSTNIEDYFTTIKTEAVSNPGGDNVASGLGGGATKLDDIKLWPVTSTKGVSFLTQSGNAVEATKKYYVELTMTFLADTDMNVYLNGEDSIKDAADDKKDGTLVAPVDTNKPADTNAVKALRISFAEQGSTDAVIYEPEKGANTVAQQTTFVDLGSNKGYINAVSNVDTTPIFSLTKGDPKVIVIRMWVEGEDPECINDPDTINIEKGKMNLRFRFCGADNNGDFIETPVN